MPQRRLILSMCCLAHAVQDGLSAAIYVLLPVLAQSLGLNLGEVGLFKGLKSLAQGLLEIVSGVAAERFGDRILLVFGLAVSALGYLLFWFAGSAAVVLACLVLVGIGTAFQHAPSSALVSRAYPDAGRRGALGLYNSSGDAGKLLFTTSFSLAIGAGLAWSVPTVGFGAVAAIAAGVLVLLLWPRGSASALFRRTAQKAKAAPENGAAKGWGILDRQGFSALLAVVFLDSMVQASALTFTAFLMLAKGQPLYIATFAATAILIGGMAGKAFCGFLADRIGPRTAFALVQALTGLAIVAAVLVPGGFAYLLLPLLGVVLQGSTSITYSMVNDFVHPSRVSRGFALIYASSSFSSVAGPLGFGLIGDRFGIETAMLAMAGVAVLAIPPCVYLRLSGTAANAAEAGSPG
ncbi:MAG: MFS transporter [Alphaproteobacteria bacterium]|nr:MFS transporter [Alphaproteobacteria bacterium]